MTDYDQYSEVPPNELSGDEALEQASQIASFKLGKGKSSIFLSSLTVTKSILGVGILGLPYVASNFGILVSVILIIFAYFQTQYATLLLLRCKNICRHSNYASIGYNIFRNRTILLVINLIIIVNNFGVCFAEMIIQGTAGTSMLKNLGYPYDNKYFVNGVSCLIMLPMMCVKKIERLKIVSLVAVLSMVIFTITVIVAFSLEMQTNGVAIGFSLLPYDFKFLNAFGSFPTLLLAYNWQFNLFPVYKGMKTISDRNIMIVCTIGMTFALTFYLLVGILGYALYGEGVATNFLKVVTEEKFGTFGFYLLNVSFYCSTVLTTPLVFFGARNNFIQLIKSAGSRQVKTQDNLILNNTDMNKTNEMIDQELSNKEISSSNNTYQSRRPNRSPSDREFYLWSIFLFVTITVLAMLISSLEVAFNFIGAVSSNSIGGILPSLFYFKLLKRSKGVFMNPSEKRQYYFAFGFFIYSIIVSIMCLLSEFFKELKIFD